MTDQFADKMTAETEGGEQSTIDCCEELVENFDVPPEFDGMSYQHQEIHHAGLHHAGLG